MLVIFDLDGTLLNTLRDLSAAANHALAVCGFPPRTEQECCRFVGNGVGKLLERALPDGDKTSENLARMKKAFFDYYDVHLTDFTRPYAGIGKTLEALQARGVKLAVASNKYQRATSKLMTHFFPQITFASVLGQQDGIPTKPHPFMVEQLLKTTGELRTGTLYVGDSDVDMLTAQNAGVTACGVTWGFRSREVLATYSPAYLIDKPEQLLEII